MANSASDSPASEKRLRSQQRKTVPRDTKGDMQRARQVSPKDVGSSQRLIERAKHEWENSVDAVHDPLFLHDREGRVIRANLAYAERAGLGIREVIGQLYWQLFPKSDGPSQYCQKCFEPHEAQEEEIHLPSGEIFLVQYTSVFDQAGNYRYSVHLMQDITERKRSENELLLFRQLLDQTGDGIFIVDPATAGFLDVNKAACHSLGYTRKELLQLGVTDVQTTFIDAAAWQAHARDMAIKGYAFIEFEALRKDNSRFPVEVSLRDVRVGEKTYIVAIVRDITERKRTEAAAAENQTLYQSLIETTNTGYVVVDTQGRVVDANAEYVRLTGRPSVESILGHSVLEWTADYEKEKNAKAVAQCARDGHIRNFEIDYVDINGGITPIEINATVVIRNEKPQILTLCRDITMRRLADRRLRRSEKELTEAQRVAHVGSWTLRPKTGNITWTDEIFRVFGLNPEEDAPSYAELQRLLTPESFARLDAAIQNTTKTGISYQIDLELVRPDGRHRWIDARGEVVHDAKGTILGLRGSALDITERKLTEQALQHSLRAQRALSACNSILVHATEENQLLADMCRNIVQHGGYRMAWIGLVEHDAGKHVRPIARAGHDAGFIKTLEITWADTEHGLGPTGRAVRNGQMEFIRNIAEDPTYAPWRAQALKRGYASTIALPLRGDDGTVFGVLDIYSAEANNFDDAEIQLLKELADDIAFGTFTLRTRHERDHFQSEHLKSVDRLKESLIGTIHAIALTVEKRDPYTAGHQGRVAELAGAIGRELGLEEARIEGLKLGAMIHDIGKIYVPAEILNRPGQLSCAEFELIKSHCEVGYDIIKDVKFPWPVAEMVLQHHEHMNGTGYPSGLKGKKIILEARILCVADTVEAISAHRPYRPALGVEAGLAEIESKRGQYYDTEVVDACLRLFREKGFVLAESP